MDKIEKYLRYDLYINNNELENNNVTLHIKVEENIQQELDALWSDNEPASVTILNRTESSPGKYQYYVLQRKISEDIISDLQMETMPGFRLKWQYNNMDLKPKGHHTVVAGIYVRYSWILYVSC